MKKTLLFLFLCLSTTVTIAQVSDLIADINGPSGLFIDGEDLYVSEYNIGVVSRINLNTNPPSKTPVLTNRSAPFGVAVIGDYLFVAEQTASRISYIDINTPIIVLNSISVPGPSGLAVSDSVLYCTAGNTIRRIDTNVSPFVSEPVILGGLADPTGVAVIGNELFMANFTSKTIDKIDLTQDTPELVNVVSAGIDNPNHLFAYGNELYFSQFTSDGKISKIDVTETNPMVVDVATGLNNPTGIAIKDDILYFSQYGANKISMLELNVVSVEQPIEGQLLVYPNPTSDNLVLDNLPSAIDVTIIDVSGKMVKTLQTDGVIDVSVLPSGTYFIQSENFPTIKFVKQ